MGRKQRPNSVKGSRFWCRRRAGGHKRAIVIYELWNSKGRGKRFPNRYTWKKVEFTLDK